MFARLLMAEESGDVRLLFPEAVYRSKSDLNNVGIFLDTPCVDQIAFPDGKWEVVAAKAIIGR